MIEAKAPPLNWTVARHAPTSAGEVTGSRACAQPASDANALLDRLDKLLCAGQLQATTRSTIATAINSISASTDTGKANRVYTAVLLVMASPDYLIQK